MHDFWVLQKFWKCVWSLAEKCPCSFLNVLPFHNLFPLLPIPQPFFSTSYLSLSLTGKLEIITVFPHFPKRAPCSKSSHVVSVLCHLLPRFMLTLPKPSLLHICILHSHLLLGLFSLAKLLIFHYCSLSWRCIIGSLTSWS